MLKSVLSIHTLHRQIFVLFLYTIFNEGAYLTELIFYNTILLFKNVETFVSLVMLSAKLE